MLKSIKYSVTFGTTGRTLKEDINFEKGFGTITGPNEAGKSFVVEMIRWSLFGSQALRGKVSEYKGAKATLVFVMGSDTYTVERSTTNAKLYRGDTEIAVGTTPVNNKVTELLGFGMEVFDTACVANQGDLEKLGSMKPTERKRMVDNVIGLGVIENLAKYAMDQARENRTRASDLAEMVKEPAPVDKPEGYRPLSELDAELAALSSAKTQRNELAAWMKIEKSTPVAPKEPVAMESSVLAELMEGQNAIKQDIQAAEMELSTMPSPSPYSDEALDQVEANIDRFAKWQQKSVLLRGVTEPTMTAPEIVEGYKALEQDEQWSHAEHLRRKLRDLESKGTHTCPECTHEWAVEVDAIEKLKQELEPIVDVQPVALLWTRQHLDREKANIDAWAAIQPQLAELEGVTECSAPQLTSADVESARRRNAYAPKRAELEAKVAELKTSLEGKPDFAKQHRERLIYEDQLKAHQKAMFDYHEWVDEKSRKANTLDALEKQLEGYDQLVELKNSVQVYEALLSRYNAEMQSYTALMENVHGFETEAAEWNKVREALLNLRGLVKQHLVPSLNKVASHYLVQMTGGQRQTITVDEDFNITVDGQALNTLSGSGKAVANLSLRLGLGQVLTNNVFSLFIGDEIDASMDKDRAENTSDTLQSLKTRISQIILVTHKFPTADYYITVGNSNGYQELELTE